ncbi:MAG: Ig-like domain-containing protein [Pseudohongiellaceae bacterium]
MLTLVATHTDSTAVTVTATVAGTSQDVDFTALTPDGVWTIIATHTEPGKVPASSAADGLMITIDTTAPVVTLDKNPDMSFATSKTYAASDADADGLTLMRVREQGPPTNPADPICPANPFSSLPYTEGADVVVTAENQNGSYRCFYSIDLAGNLSDVTNAGGTSDQIGGIDQPPTVTLSAGDITINTGATTVITVAISEAVTGFVVGDITVSGGGTLGTDLALVTGSTNYTVTFTAGSSATTATLSVPANSFNDTDGITVDRAADGNEASNMLEITVEVAAPTAAIPRASFSTTTLSVTEGDVLEVAVNLTAVASTGNTIEVSVLETRAAPSQTSVFIDSAEYHTANVLGFETDGSASTETRQFTIDNDMVTGGGGTIVLTIVEAQHTGGTYTIGESTTLTITVADAGVSPTVTIAAGNSPIREGTNATYTLTADPAPSGADLVVTVDVSGITSFLMDGMSPSAVTIAADASNATLRVVTENDMAVDSNGYLVATVDAGTGYILGDPSAASVLVLNDDFTSGNPRISLSSSIPTSVTEGDTLNIVVVADPSQSTTFSSEVVVSQSRQFIPASQLESGRMIFNNPTATATMITVTVTLHDDEMVGGGGTIVLTIPPISIVSGDGWVVGDPSTITITVADAGVPVPPILSITANKTEVTEGAADATVVFTVTSTEVITTGLAMEEQPHTGVAVSYVPSGDDGWLPQSQQGGRDVQISIGGSMATFSVTIDDDDMDEADGTLVYTISAPRGFDLDPDATSVTVNVMDDDEMSAAPTVGLAAGSDSGIVGDSITNDDTPTITVNVGTSVTNAEVRVMATHASATAVSASASSVSGTGTEVTLGTLAEGQWSVTALYIASGATSATTSGNDVLTVTIDTTGPTIMLGGATTFAGLNATITLVTNEDPIGLTESDVNVTGGTVVPGSFAGSGRDYTVDIRAASAGAAATVSVATGTFTDAAGNANTDAAGNANGTTSAGIAPDTTGPTVAISTGESTLNSGDTATITFTISEATSNFAVGDITLAPATGAGTLSAFAGSGTRYTATFTAGATAATVTISVPADALTDAADNGNTASNNLPITITAGTDMVVLQLANHGALAWVNSSVAMEVDNIIRHRMTMANFNGGTGGQESGLTLQGASPMQFLANQARGRGDAYANGRRAAEFVMPSDIGFAVALTSINADSPIVLWGRTFQTDMKGNAKKNVTLDGDLSGLMVGIDVTTTTNQIWGLGVLGANSELSYKVGDVSGVHETSISGLHPYFGVELDGGLRLWGSVGINNGKTTIAQSDNPNSRYTSDINMRSYGFGGSRPFRELRSDTDTPLQLGFIADTMFTKTKEDRPGGIRAVSGRARVGMEISHDRVLDFNNTLRLTGEATWRQDFGDGLSGGGAEISGGVDIVIPSSRLVVGVDLRTLLFHSSDLREWGIGINFAWMAHPNNRGLSLTFNPQWGPTSGQANKLWQATLGAFNQDGAGGNAFGVANNYEGSYGLEIKYGLSILENEDLLELYARGNLINYRGMSLGANFSLGETFTAGYEAALGYGGHGGTSTGQNNISSITSATPGTLDYIMRNLQPGTAGHQYFNTGSTYTSPLQQATANGQSPAAPTQQLNHRAYIRYHKRF